MPSGERWLPSSTRSRSRRSTWTSSSSFPPPSRIELSSRSSRRSHFCANVARYKKESTSSFRVFRFRFCRQEHLLAILVQTGRDKDRARIPLLLEGTPPDRRLLDEILERHGLRGRWDQWTKGPHV